MNPALAVLCATVAFWFGVWIGHITTRGGKP